MPADTTKEETILNNSFFVKHKKTEGDLFLMKERIAWMPKNQGIYSFNFLNLDLNSKQPILFLFVN